MMRLGAATSPYQAITTSPNRVEHAMRCNELTHLDAPYTDESGGVYYEASVPQAQQPRPEWITIIGGFSRTSRDFNQLQKQWHAQGYGVVVMDNRGAGQSIASQPFPFSTFIDDVRRVWNSCGITRSHLLGFSMGGVISQFVAMDHPTQVTSLTLVSTFARWPDHHGAADHPEPELWHPATQYVAATFARQYPHFLKALAGDIRRKTKDPHAVAQATYQRAAFANVPLPIPHERIHQPTLIIHGAEDAIVHPDMAQQLHDAIKNSDLKIYAECGHLPLVEKGTQLFKDITEFIASNAGQS